MNHRRHLDRRSRVPEAIAASALLLALGGWAFNSWQMQQLDEAVPTRPQTGQIATGLGEFSTDGYLQSEKARKISEDQKMQERQRRQFEKLSIAPSQIVEVTIKDAGINSAEVAQYDVVANIVGNSITYNPPSLTEVYTADITVGDVTYGPLGIEDGRLVNDFQAFGHTWSKGDGAFDNLGNMQAGSGVVVTTEDGTKYTFVASDNPLYPRKDDTKSLSEQAGVDGRLFTCYTKNVDGRQVISDDQYTMVPLKFVAITTKDGKIFDTRVLYS